MQKYQSINFLLNLLYSFLKLFLVALLFMGLARGYLLFSHGSISEFGLGELFASFFLGLRLDSSVLAYIFSLPVLLSPLFMFRFLQTKAYALFRVYFFLIFTVVFFMIFTDFSYFSFFGEHSTLMIFGVFDDDTEALVRTAFDNYNVAFVAFFIVIILSIIYFIVFKILREKKSISVEWGVLKGTGIYLSVIVLVALLGRGSLGLFPLAYNTPDPTSNQFLNNLSKSAPFALFDSYNAYEKSKNGNYDLIKDVGFRGKMDEAFKIHTQKATIDEKNLLNNIKYTTPVNKAIEDMPPHVVVVMVESFGMPLLDYQSKIFNIMGRIQKHFKEDILFNRFISASNGTVVSLEPLLLNITARPQSTAFAQGKYLNTAFTQASAKVYKDAGYETNFIYGGDLSWRNVGNFMSKQGFTNIDGRVSIAKSLGENREEISHDWGVFDGYLYKYIEKKLKNATKPQFIFVLTTNNHPPYKIPNDYKSNTLELSEKLKAHITGDMDLAKRRFKDYAYAVDMAGEFLDHVKESDLAKKTVVAITGDNNTVEGIMKYDDYYNQTKRIPFYLYLPEYLKPKEKIDMTLASSHKDIFPTLYNLTLSDKEYMAIGTNLLDKSHIHCGFNDAGVIMSKDGGFKLDNPKTQAEAECQEYYKATLAVTEYLIKSQE